MKQIIRKIQHINYIKIIKIAVGTSISILIADFFGLKYSASAGIITLLSIQDTKKETLLIAFKRYLACLLAFAIAYIVFQLLGYQTIVFGLFLFLFISSSYLLKIHDGIAMCSVLVTHFLIDKNMELSFIINEFLLLIIGTSMGILLNLYMPSSRKYLEEEIKNTEYNIKNILGKLSDYILLDPSDKTKGNIKIKLEEQLNKELEELVGLLQKAIDKAYDNMNNTLKSHTKYYLEYFVMRREQVTTLKRIFSKISLLTMLPKQANQIVNTIKKIETQFHEYNNALSLIEEFHRIKDGFKDEMNPVTREEFENRAVLYLVLNDLENFLYLKKEFVDHLTKEEIKLYWTRDHSK